MKKTADSYLAAPPVLGQLLQLSLIVCATDSCEQIICATKVHMQGSHAFCVHAVLGSCTGPCAVGHWRRHAQGSRGGSCATTLMWQLARVLVAWQNQGRAVGHVSLLGEVGLAHMSPSWHGGCSHISPTGSFATLHSLRAPCLAHSSNRPSTSRHHHDFMHS